MLPPLIALLASLGSNLFIFIYLFILTSVDDALFGRPSKWTKQVTVPFLRPPGDFLEPLEG
jgi:hypothetical protein